MATNQKKLAELPATGGPDVTAPARILIVDDERHNRLFLEVSLASEGFLLTSASSGEAALEAVARQPPDLILLDVMMPGMNGYEVAGKIKGNPATKHIPIVMITALADRGSRLLGLSAGAEEFLTKPVDRAELCIRVRNLLRLKFYGDYFDQYSQLLEGEVSSRTADLVERTNTLERQAEVLAEQAALLDLAQDAIVVRDMHGRVLLWSRGAESMYGWLGTDALGRDMSELLHTELSEPTEKLDAMLLGEGHWEGEVVHHRRDGTRLVVASRWALQRDADGAPVRILEVNSDITDRRRVEFERLSERQVADEALEQSRQAQMRFKNEFLSHVSHELRSPLTAVKQFTTILLGGLAGELNQEQCQYQQIVLRNIRQLQAMIDDLLEVTRLETGKLSVALARVSVSDAVTDTLNTLHVTAHAKGVRVSCDVPSDLPAALADQTRVRQILIILLDNAIKFSSDGDVVRVQARLLEDDPGFLVLDVSDTGCGINSEMAEKIFDRLYQAAAPRGSRKGLGLGLYICKELVTRQGGRISVRPHSPKGSVFSFTLPVCSLNAAVDPPIDSDNWPVESAWRSVPTAEGSGAATLADEKMHPTGRSQRGHLGGFRHE